MNELANTLYHFGFTKASAIAIAARARDKGLALADAQAWIQEAQTSTSLRNPLGFVRARLQDGDKLNARAPAASHHPQTATCKCGRLVPLIHICTDCYLCPYCCTCLLPYEDEESTMNDTPDTTNDKLDYALLLIDRLRAPLLARTANLGQITQQLDTIKHRFCTGRTHWRDQNAPGKTPKLYVLHSTDETCPIHGTPSPGQRTRVYVGNKPDKIGKALDDIERTSEHTDLQRQLHRIEQIIWDATWHLQDIYRKLDYTPPAPGDDTPTPPAAHVPTP